MSVKINLVAIPNQRRAYTVWIDGKLTALYVTWDKDMSEWDLDTEETHLMSSHSRRHLMYKLTCLLKVVGIEVV
jgi:hypothetical protein